MMPVFEPMAFSIVSDGRFHGLHSDQKDSIKHLIRLGKKPYSDIAINPKIINLHSAEQLTEAYEQGKRDAYNQVAPDNIGDPALSQQECYRIGHEAVVASIRKSEDVDCFSASIEAAYEQGKRDAIPEGFVLVKKESK